MVGSSSEVVDYDVSRIRCGGGVHGLSRAAAAENGAHIYKFRVPDMSRNSSTEKGKKDMTVMKTSEMQVARFCILEIYVLFRYVLKSYFASHETQMNIDLFFS